MIDNLVDYLAAFGWMTFGVWSSEQREQLLRAIEEALEYDSRVEAVIDSGFTKYQWNPDLKIEESDFTEDDGITIPESIARRAVIDTGETIHESIKQKLQDLRAQLLNSRDSQT